MIRKGLGKGLGMGYKNIAPLDSHIHSLSAKGVKTMLLRRVPYGKSTTPKKDREYQWAEVSGSPVGTINEWNDFAKKSGVKKLKVRDFDKNFDVTVKAKGRAVWNAPCGYQGTKGEMTKHQKDCQACKNALKRDEEFKKSLLNAKGKKKKKLIDEQKVRRGLGTALGLVAGAEATKGTRYEGVGALAGGYAGYKLAEGLDAKGDRVNMYGVTYDTGDGVETFELFKNKTKAKSWAKKHKGQLFRANVLKDAIYKEGNMYNYEDQAGLLDDVKRLKK